MSFLFYLSCLPISITLTQDEVLGISPNQEEDTYEALEILFDERGRANDAPLVSVSSQKKWSRTYTGVLQEPSKKKYIEITSYCEREIPAETERVCLPKYASVSIFAPFILESNSARSLFHIKGFEKVWIHDVDILILPHPNWIQLQEQCTLEEQECESIYAVRIAEIFPDKTVEILSNIFFSPKTKNPPCITNANDFQQVRSWESFIRSCPLPYTSLLKHWKEHITISFVLRRMGYVFELADNDSVHVERIRVRGITNDGIIYAENNGSVAIEHNQMEGISQEDLNRYDRKISLPFLSPATNNKIMGTGISIVEGEIESEHFDCQEKNSMLHRKSCVGRSTAKASCQHHEDCEEDARCVLGMCKSSSCDTKKVQIKHNRISGCSEFDWSIQKKINDDGIRLSSVSAQIEHNQIIDFVGCDTLLDVGHRGSCDAKEGEIPESITIAENVFENGKIKTTGSSGPQNTVVFSKNIFRNIRLSDYHQYWISVYIDNDWHIEENAKQQYIWGEHASIGAQPWQDPYYGKMIFENNRIWSKKDNIALLQTKRFDQQKFSLRSNQFFGKSFVWLVSLGEKRLLESVHAPSQQFFIDQNWTQQKDEIVQLPVRIRDWKRFQQLFPDNNTWEQSNGER